MAWCCQTISHYLSQCWPRFICHHMALASLGHPYEDDTRCPVITRYICLLLMPWLLCLTRSSATMTLTMQDKGVIVFHEEGLQLPLPHWCFISRKCKIIFFIFLKINATQGSTHWARQQLPSIFPSPHLSSIHPPSSGTHFTKIYEFITQNYFCSVFHFNEAIRPQICTCHDSSAVMACAKLWPDLTIIFHTRARNIFKQFGSWAHKLFVTWVGSRPCQAMLTECDWDHRTQTHGSSSGETAHYNWSYSQIPQCTCHIFHNAPFKTKMCTFLFWIMHCGIWSRCIMGFVKLVYWK